MMLTPHHFKSLQNLRIAWREISAFLKSLGLDPADYRDRFDANYVPRMKWGAMR